MQVRPTPIKVKHPHSKVSSSLYPQILGNIPRTNTQAYHASVSANNNNNNKKHFYNIGIYSISLQQTLSPNKLVS
jgi:hypothetical protein